MIWLANKNLDSKPRLVDSAIMWPKRARSEHCDDGVMMDIYKVY